MFGAEFETSETINQSLTSSTLRIPDSSCRTSSHPVRPRLSSYGATYTKTGMQEIYENDSCRP